MQPAGIGVITSNTESAPVAVREGDIYCQLGGTFGGATVTLLISTNDGVFYSPIDAAGVLTAPGSFTATVPDCLLKWSVAGGTSQSINWSFARKFTKE